MPTITDFVNVQPATAAPITPPPAARQAPIAPVADREGANNRRQSNSGQRGLNFRSVLSTATFDGLAQAVSRDTTNESADTPARPPKVPTGEPTVLSATETAGLYRAAQDQSTRTAAASQFRAATTRYAKSFFAVDRTYARPGETLEITA